MFHVRLSVNFHQMSQNATPATEFAPRHHFAQPWHCDSQKKTRSTTRWKFRACHAKWRWRSPKCCACDERCNASSENVCHGKRLLTRHETCMNITKCHACHAKRSDATLENDKNAPFCRTYHRHGHSDLARTVANGCERLGNVWRTQLNPQTHRVKREPLLRIRENSKF